MDAQLPRPGCKDGPELSTGQLTLTSLRTGERGGGEEVGGKWEDGRRWKFFINK